MIKSKFLYNIQKILVHVWWKFEMQKYRQEMDTYRRNLTDEQTDQCEEVIQN